MNLRIPRMMTYDLLVVTSFSTDTDNRHRQPATTTCNTTRSTDEVEHAAVSEKYYEDIKAQEQFSLHIGDCSSLVGSTKMLLFFCATEECMGILQRPLAQTRRRLDC